MDRRQLLKLVPPVLLSSLAGCGSNNNQSNDNSGPAESGGNGDGNSGTNQRYGLPPCDEDDRLVQVRDVSIEDRGLVRDAWHYIIKIAVEPKSTEALVIRVQYGEVIGPDGEQLAEFETTSSYEYDTYVTDNFEFEIGTESRYDSSELSVESLRIQAMPADEWEVDDSVAPLSGTANQGCY